MNSQESFDKWISIKDRLPEVLDIVLIYVKEYKVPYAGYLGENGIWLDQYATQFGYSPSHWLPLPAAPIGETK